jgi:glucose-6-phosphate 1-dehydrogenase
MPPAKSDATNLAGTLEVARRELLDLGLRNTLLNYRPVPDDMDAYERVLGDAMAGDAALFAREDYVEEAWRIVDPALKAPAPVSVYEQKTWGPAEVEKQVSPPGGWLNPVP